MLILSPIGSYWFPFAPIVSYWLLRAPLAPVVSCWLLLPLLGSYWFPLAPPCAFQKKSALPVHLLRQVSFGFHRFYRILIDLYGFHRFRGPEVKDGITRAWVPLNKQSTCPCKVGKIAGSEVPSLIAFGFHRFYKILIDLYRFHGFLEPGVRHGHWGLLTNSPLVLARLVRRQDLRSQGGFSLGFIDFPGF